MSVLKMPRVGGPVSLLSEVDGRGMADGAHYLPSSPGDNNSESTKKGSTTKFYGRQTLRRGIKKMLKFLSDNLILSLQGQATSWKEMK